MTDPQKLLGVLFLIIGVFSFLRCFSHHSYKHPLRQAIKDVVTSSLVTYGIFACINIFVVAFFR